METAKRPYSFKPVIMIGAGRSGTKIIRDVIASHPMIDAVPFDVNYIWKIGNQDVEHDKLEPHHLSDKIRETIISQFIKQSNGSPFLLGKTVSNTLRIPFVQKVFPDALFIHLVRDGCDVVESVVRQWGEVREISYFFKKLKTFPLRYALSYLIEYASNWLKFGLRNQGNKDYIWGVKYPGYQEDLKSMSREEICAKQWKICVETSLRQFENVEPARILFFKYEEFVVSPEEHLKSVAEFLSLEEKSAFDYSELDPSYIGKFKTSFSNEERNKLFEILRPTLTKLNYI